MPEPQGTAAGRSRRSFTQAELAAEAARRFGADPLDYAFTCPGCGDTATVRDFAEAGGSEAATCAGQECIGRSLGATRRGAEPYQGRGCDWTAYGFFPGPWAIRMPDGTVVRSFPLAEGSNHG